MPVPKVSEDTSSSVVSHATKVRSNRSFRTRATVGAARQHDVGREQAGEDEAVAHQVHPETEDGVLAGVVVFVVVMAMDRRVCGVPVVHVVGDSAAHACNSDFTRPCACR